MLESLCTIATEESWVELQLMIKSFRLYHVDVPIYVMCDENISKRTKNFDIDLCHNIVYIIDLPSKTFRQVGGNSNDWLELMLKKTDVMDIALTNHYNTLFVDSDMIFVFPVYNLPFGKYDVFLSPHNIREEQEKAYGKFNGGYVATNNKYFPHWWKKMTYDRPGFYEQKTLNYTSEVFKVDWLGKEHNFAWYRFSQEHNSKSAQEKCVTWYDGRWFKYLDKPIISFHTHLDNPERRFHDLNLFILNNLQNSQNPLHRKTYGYVSDLGLA